MNLDKKRVRSHLRTACVWHSKAVRYRQEGFEVSLQFAHAVVACIKAHELLFGDVILEEPDPQRLDVLHIPPIVLMYTMHTNGRNIRTIAHMLRPHCKHQVGTTQVEQLGEWISFLEAKLESINWKSAKDNIGSAQKDA